MRCEVLDTCNLVVGKGSIVEVSERQYELARKYLRPLATKEKKVDNNEEKVEVPNEVEVPQKEVRKKKK